MTMPSASKHKTDVAEQHIKKKPQTTKRPETKTLRVTRASTREKTPDGARHAVFFTAELLEWVLSHLPWRDLYVCQMVSRQFRDIISKSTTLRQIMFLLPGGIDVGNEVRYDRGKLCGSRSNERRVDIEPMISDMRVCPLLRAYRPYRNPRSKSAMPRRGTIRCNIEMPLPSRIRDESWQHMQLALPNVSEVFLDFTWTNKSSTGTQGFCVISSGHPFNCDQGFTLGSLLKAALSADSFSQGYTSVTAKSGEKSTFFYDRTLAEIIEKMENLLGAPARLNMESSRFHFIDPGIK